MRPMAGVRRCRFSVAWGFGRAAKLRRKNLPSGFCAGISITCAPRTAPCPCRGWFTPFKPEPGKLSAHGPTAVRMQHLAGDVAGVLGGQKNVAAGHLPRLTRAPQGRGFAKLRGLRLGKCSRD